MATVPVLPPHEPPPLGRQDLSAQEFVETRSVKLEWKVSNLKNLFEQSKGEAKSKCVKSALFDNHRWQIFLYPNSGHEQYCSLYLSCEPTAAEKERGLAERAGWAATREGQVAGTGGPGAGGAPEAVGIVGGTAGGKMVGKDVKGPWKREGKFKFTFELRSADRRSTFKQMEAHDHSFSDSARNWGYSSFSSRSECYYNNPSVRLADAFLIVCTIVYSPTPPSPPPLPRLLIPKDLVTAYASLFDDPDYSDIVFRIRPSGRPGRRERRIYGMRKVLAGRCEYFEDMFSSGFHESTQAAHSHVQPTTTSTSSPRSRFATLSVASSEASFTDDDDDDDDDWDEDDDTDVEEDYEDEEGSGDATRPDDAEGEQQPGEESGSRASSAAVSDDDEEEQHEGESGDEAAGGGIKTPERRRSAPSSATFVDAPVAPESPTKSVTLKGASTSSRPTSQDEASLRTSTTTTAGLRSAPFPLTATSISAPTPKRPSKPKDTRPRFEVIVTDAGYQSYRSLLHYLYTDSITFLPLSSSYHVARETSLLLGTPFSYTSRRAYLLANTPFPAGAQSQGSGDVGPCSAKAIYRLADKIGLNELKERAFEHIVKSLTVQNIPYEVFGSFSSKFEEIKRVEINFLLEKWSEAKQSTSMKKVFDHLRTGRFPGFEDVWIRILKSLEYVPNGGNSSEEDESVRA